LAIHKSVEKRDRQSEKRRLQSAAIRAGIKTKMKNVISALGKKDKEGAVNALSNAVPSIAKAAAKGAFHKKTASRRISRLTKKVNALQK
jgi:small subunit ribosomal protein S20